MWFVFYCGILNAHECKMNYQANMQDDLCWHNFNYLTLTFEYKPLNVGPHWHWSRDLKIIYLIMIIYHCSKFGSWNIKLNTWPEMKTSSWILTLWLKKGFIFSLESTDLVTLVTIKQRLKRYWVDITSDKKQQFDQHWSFTT